MNPYFGLRSYQDDGAHYAGQIGSEATPAEFVDALIAATREMVRVLKPSGSIFVNLGDRMSNGISLDNTLTVGDAGWLAGLIDADGTITVRFTQQPTMRAPTFEGIISVEQMDQEAVRRCHAITGRGAIAEVNGSRGRTMYRWTVSTQQARWVAERIWPFLRIKHRQARAIVELARHREECQARGRYAQIKPEWITYRQKITDAVRAWNRREAHDWEPPALPVVDLPLRPHFIPAKSLVGVPWRYALRCIDELGLILRAEVIWSKNNGLPESVTDRVRRSHEQWFHMTREPRYFSAVDEIREVYAPGTAKRALQGWKDPDSWKVRTGNNLCATDLQDGYEVNPLGKLPGSVWSIPTQPLTVPPELGVDHFAAFPMEWPRRIIQGWSPAGVCTGCGEGRRPVAVGGGLTDAALALIENRNALDRYSAAARNGGDKSIRQHQKLSGIERARMANPTTITGYACGCPGPTAPTRPAVILDPFGGTGTTVLVAKALGRIGISVDMSADYCRLAAWRTTDPGQMAAALQVERPEPVSPDQLDLFSEVM